ncbi:methyltransferase domain-containing protein [Paenibacillus polygoni]|uniref:Methyltransferase domain-containing protein n=1 Tax=Paenibacillus polygoni TaxID=3050112 RepID=A0ABY8X4K6_9BACL|nr:methyltransferase domain-containing protein [Paenibacillus polygoni]WIV18894.1 methyltransferase domain-containing protein [Paenibacillus polygoni]
MRRVYLEKVDIDPESLREFYKKRAIDKVSIDIDAPVVLVGDKDKSKIEEWTKFEIEHRLSHLCLNSSSKVLEFGCGTGRISKYITSIVDLYVGVDYVKEFIDLIQSREDIEKKDTTHFIHSSVQEYASGLDETLPKNKFDRFVISGGVFMYINDEEIKEILDKLILNFEENCIVYLSEPIALNERLTLDKFYSKELKNEYSAIYRTEKEYNEILNILYKEGFELKLSEEFFHEDIKTQTETKQWIFVLKRNRKQL